MQLSQLMSRDEESDESARAMMGAQAGRRRRLEAGDDILNNISGVAELIDALHKLHELYLDIARHPTQTHPGIRLP